MPCIRLLTHPGHVYNSSEQGYVRHIFRWSGIDIFCDRASSIAHIHIAGNDIRGVAQKGFTRQSGHRLEAECVFLAASRELAHNQGNAATGYSNNTGTSENEEATTIQCTHRSYLPCGCPR